MLETFSSKCVFFAKTGKLHEIWENCNFEKQCFFKNELLIVTIGRKIIIVRSIWLRISLRITFVQKVFLQNVHLSIYRPNFLAPSRPLFPYSSRSDRCGLLEMFIWTPIQKQYTKNICVAICSIGNVYSHGPDDNWTRKETCLTFEWGKIGWPTLVKSFKCGNWRNNKKSGLRKWENQNRWMILE